MSRLAHRDLVPALILLTLGGYGLWEAAGMSTLGRVFPTLASLGLILGALALMARGLLGGADVAPAAAGPILRPMLLLAILAGWAFLLPVTGFVATSIVGTLLCMAVAEHDRPGAKAWAVQVASLIGLVLLLALVFGRILLVNLP